MAFLDFSTKARRARFDAWERKFKRRGWRTVQMYDFSEISHFYPAYNDKFTHAPWKPLCGHAWSRELTTVMNPAPTARPCKKCLLGLAARRKKGYDLLALEG